MWEEKDQNVVIFSDGTHLRASEGNSVVHARSGRRCDSHGFAVVLGGSNLVVNGAEERGWMLHEVPEGNVGA